MNAPVTQPVAEAQTTAAAPPANPAYATVARLSNREILGMVRERDRLLRALEFANARLVAPGAEPVRVAELSGPEGAPTVAGAAP